jgi:carbonic anhydrase
VFGGVPVPTVTDSIFSIILYTLALVVGGGRQEHNPQHSWDYGEALGPSHWGDLKPEFATCKTGHRQSPIDIRDAQKANLPPILFEYQPSPLHIIDNGHTVMVNYALGSSISVAGKRYALKQFHFHRPSEEKVNGETFDMSVHFVHADQDGKLAVVAVLLRKGEDNPLIGEIWKALPREKEKEEQLDQIRIDASRILPSNRGYYTFSGSLTTPPCSEDVTWFVLKNPVAVSEQEIDRFSQLYRNDARPTQPLHGRTVLESQ